MISAIYECPSAEGTNIPTEEQRRRIIEAEAKRKAAEYARKTAEAARKAEEARRQREAKLLKDAQDQQAQAEREEKARQRSQKGLEEARKKALERKSQEGKKGGWWRKDPNTHEERTHDHAFVSGRRAGRVGGTQLGPEDAGLMFHKASTRQEHPEVALDPQIPVGRKFGISM